jgi:hypothetical protein
MGILETLMGKVIAPLQDRQNNPTRTKELEESVPQIKQGITGKGLNNEPMIEPIPQYAPAACERVISNGTNAWIVIGKDRPSNKASGYGGQGATGAGSIDIVVGRGPLNSNTSVDPNFVTDAARIHISQTTDVDRNFGLTGGFVGPSQGRSAIGMKADDVRIIGRQGVKIITEGRGVDNSKGGNIKTTIGIDLIAGNDDTNLQPIPLGNTLVACLSDMTDLMDDLAAIVSANSWALVKTNFTLGTHFHQSPFLGLPTTPSIPAAIASSANTTNLFTQAIAPMQGYRINTTTFRVDNFEPVGDQWICSRFNATN